MRHSPRFAVALGGGAARGWSHIGILRALTEAGLAPQIVAGTSIGAIVGGHYAAGRLNELEAFALSLTRRCVLRFIDFSIAGSGLISGRRLFDRFDVHLNGCRIEGLPVRFVAIATDLKTGNEVWLRRGSVSDAVRASSAIPGVVRPVNLGGRWLLDGCLVNPIPVSACRALGADVVVGINLTGEFSGSEVVGDEFEAVVEDKADQIESKVDGGLRFFRRQSGDSEGIPAPSVSTVVLNSFSIFHDRVARARLLSDPSDLLITPNLADVKVLDFHRAAEMIENGRKAIAPHIDAITRLLKTSAEAPKGPALRLVSSREGTSVLRAAQSSMSVGKGA